MVSVGTRLEERRSPESRKPATVATLRLILTRGSVTRSERNSARLSKPNVKKCDRVGHFTENCDKGKGFPKDGKKAKVSVLTAEETEVESAAPPAAELSAALNAPAAALNSVEQVKPYQFNPEQYQDYRMENSGWW